MRLVGMVVLIVSLSLAQAHAEINAAFANLWLELPIEHRTRAEALERMVMIFQQLGAVRVIAMDVPWHTDFYGFPDDVRVSALVSFEDDTDISLHCISLRNVGHAPSYANAERYCEAIRESYLGPDY